MYSVLFATTLDKLRNRPRTRFDASRLRWSASDRDVCLAKVVVSEIERDRSLKVFQLLAERVCQAREASAVPCATQSM